MNEMRQLIEASKFLFEDDTVLSTEEVAESYGDELGEDEHMEEELGYDPTGIATDAIRKAIMYFTFIANESDEIQDMQSLAHEAIAEMQEFKQALRRNR